MAQMPVKIAIERHTSLSWGMAIMSLNPPINTADCKKVKQARPASIMKYAILNRFFNVLLLPSNYADKAGLLTLLPLQQFSYSY